MKTLLAILGCGYAMVASAQLQQVSGDVSQAVFAGRMQKVNVSFRNPGNRAIKAALRYRLYQASAVTVMPLGDVKAWKEIEVLPEQTVLETITLSLPVVASRTLFQVHWLDDREKPIGRSNVFAYPVDLITQMKVLAGSKPIGLLDPDDQIKPLFREQQVAFEDLGVGQGLAGFHGKLVVFGPFSESHPMTPSISEAMGLRIKGGLAVVWLEASNVPPSPGAIPAYVLRFGEGTVVVASAVSVSGLSQSPAAQLNLVQFAQWAVKPEVYPFLQNPP